MKEFQSSVVALPGQVRVLALDLAWAGPTGWAICCQPGDLIINSGVITQPRTRAKLVDEETQIMRALSLYHALHALLKRSSIESISTVYYETAQTWILAKARSHKAQRKRVSRESILAVGRVQVPFWLACGDFNIVPVPVSPNEVRARFAAGMMVPPDLEDIAKEKYPAGKEFWGAAVFLRTGQWLETDHEVDAAIIGLVKADEERLNCEETDRV